MKSLNLSCKHLWHFVISFASVSCILFIEISLKCKYFLIACTSLKGKIELYFDKLTTDLYKYVRCA